MRVTMSAAAFLILIGCGGRTVLDDPNDELPLDGGHHVSSGSGSGSGSSSGATAGDAGRCGGATCTDTEDCCVMTSGLNGAMTPPSKVSSSFACVPKGTCMGVAASCASKNDCSGGDICCATIPGGIGAAFSGGGMPNVTVSCDKSCPSGGFQLCASDSECPSGVTCQSTPFMVSLCGGINAVLGGTGGTGGFGGFGGFGGAGH